MDDILKAVATQAPGLVILAVIVTKFLTFLRAREENLKLIAEKCHEVQRDAIIAIKENSTVIGANTAIARDVQKVLQKIHNGE